MMLTILTKKYRHSIFKLVQNMFLDIIVYDYYVVSIIRVNLYYLYWFFSGHDMKVFLLLAIQFGICYGIFKLYFWVVRFFLQKKMF